MSASPMSHSALTRLPVPHLFMVLSFGIFALMVLLTFAPATAGETDPAATGPQPDVDVVLAADGGVSIGVRISAHIT